MKRIVRVHHPRIEEELVDQAVVAFYELRDIPRLRKRPSTSELVDWIAVLKRAGIGEKRFIRELPFLGVLLEEGAGHGAREDREEDRVPGLIAQSRPIAIR